MPVEHTGDYPFLELYAYLSRMGRSEHACSRNFQSAHDTWHGQRMDHTTKTKGTRRHGGRCYSQEATVYQDDSRVSVAACFRKMGTRVTELIKMATRVFKYSRRAGADN